MRKSIYLLMLSLISIPALAQDLLETIKQSELTSIYIDSAIYSEVAASATLKDKNIIIGGFHYGEDRKRQSTIFLFDPLGNTLKNGYDSDFLSYFLFEDYENFVNDIIPAKDGGAYILGSSDHGDFYTGYLVKVSNKVEIDEDFMIPKSEDTGFVRIHNYKMVLPNTEADFQDLEDTTYCEPQTILMQKDGKLLIIGVTRKQMSAYNYKDGESFIMRLFPDGKIDHSYGVDGIAHINLSQNCDDVRTAILDSDDNVILYGLYDHSYKSSSIAQFEQSYITKVNKSGKIDRTFGDNGVYIFEMPQTISNPVAIIEQRDRSLLFFSNKETKIEDGTFNYGLAILKLNKNGQLVRGFYDNGVQVNTKMGIGFCTDIIKTKDNKILICGTNQNPINEHLDGKIDLLFSSKDKSPDVNYTESELNQESAIGFSMRLNEDGSLDKTYPKDGLFFTRKNDMRMKIFFSKIIPTINNHYLIFGAGNSDSRKSIISFLKINIVSSLDFGELVCQKEFSMSFYPNPVQDRATISFELCSEDAISATLLDLSGKMMQTFFDNKLFRKGRHSEQIIINNALPKGMYILNLKGKNVAKAIKIIIQ